MVTRGAQNRVVAATTFNEESSRSHSMMTIYIEKSFQTRVGAEVHDRVVAAKLNLVDLVRHVIPF